MKDADAIDAAAHDDHVESPIRGDPIDPFLPRIGHGFFLCGSLPRSFDRAAEHLQAGVTLKLVVTAREMSSISRSDRRRAPARAFSLACSGFRAPQSAKVSPGCAKVQAITICAGLASCCTAIGRTVSITRSTPARFSVEKRGSSRR